MAKRTIHITTGDAAKLNDLLHVAMRRDRRDHANLMVLSEELRRATLVDPGEVAPDVVTMHSTVRIVDLDTGEASKFTLVFPEELESVDAGISVVAPIGAAVLGYKKGDTVRFHTPGGQRTLVIDQVLYQPEATERAALQAV